MRKSLLTRVPRPDHGVRLVDAAVKISCANRQALPVTGASSKKVDAAQILPGSRNFKPSLRGPTDNGPEFRGVLRGTLPGARNCHAGHPATQSQTEWLRRAVPAHRAQGALLNLFRRSRPRRVQAGCPGPSRFTTSCSAPCRTWRNDAHRVSTRTPWRESPSQPDCLHRSRRENQRRSGPPGMQM